MEETYRRNRLDLCTPAELAIFNAMQEVEKAGADERLTEAIILLEKAKNCVADFVDGIEPKVKLITLGEARKIHENENIYDLQPVTAKTEQETPKCKFCKDEHWIITHEGRVSEPCPACGGGERYKKQENPSEAIAKEEITEQSAEEIVKIVFKGLNGEKGCYHFPELTKLVILCMKEYASQKHLITAKSGRKYRSIPEGVDVETWDEMTPDERIKYTIKGQKHLPTDAQVNEYLNNVTGDAYRWRIQEFWQWVKSNIK